MTAPLLEMREITKRFPGVAALTNVDLTLHAGEVLALCGENGAGKSTLMKILGGVYAPDEGEILIDGRKAIFAGPSDARAAGVSLVHQELLLVSQLDVAANLNLGRERSFGLGGPMRFADMRGDAKKLLDRVGLDIDLATPVGKLSPAKQQMVEIARALSGVARILVMDEPTSSLGAAEANRLFEVIDDLRRRGTAIVYISHRMDEVFRVADRIAVLRDGRAVGELDPKKDSVDRVVSMMVGRPRSRQFPTRRKEPNKEVMLRVDGLIPPGAREGATFDLHKGEILGFAGLIGSGRTELMQTIAGLDQPLQGKMLIDGRPYEPRFPREALASGVFLAPEDRKQHGLLLDFSITENIAVPATAKRGPFAWIMRGREKSAAKQAIADLNVRTYGPQQKTVTLSGGNQQKVVLAKWLALGPKVLILDEPTRGIDVGAKAEIYERIVELADAGVSILLVSSEMEEVLGLSDRIVVMRGRRLVGVVDRAEATEERLMQLMAGAGGVAA
jgi:ribose transport system ATP-binding protein